MNICSSRRYAGLVSGGIARIVVLVGLLCIASGKAFAAGPDFGAHSESVEDMRVKVLGGYFSVTRTWVNNGWIFSRQLSKLLVGNFSTPIVGVGDTKVLSLKRNDDEYFRVGDTNRFTREYDPRQTITQTDSGYRWEDRAGNWMSYGADFQFVAYGNRNGVTVTARYDASGRLTGFVDRNGKQFLWLEYNQFNRINAVRDYSGRRVEYRYIADSRSIDKFTDIRGNIWTYTYEGTKLKTKTDPEGRTITLGYGANGTVVSILDQDKVGITFKYEYDKNKREYYKQERSAAGRVKEIWYDAEGDVIRQDIGGRTVSVITKDGRNRIEIDESGNKTIREYDEWENLTKIIYPDGSKETKIYGAVYSNVLEEVDANGAITRHEYDAKGDLVKTTEAVGKPEQRVTTYIYDQFGQRLTATRAADAVSVEVTRSSIYDEYGNEITQTDGEAHTAEFTYDVMGNVLTRKDPRGKTWTNTYDAAGNLTTETDPIGNATKYAYDGVGNRTRVTDAKGRITQYKYNTQHRLVETIGPTTASTKLEYDVDGNLLKRIDQDGKFISVSYDSSSRPKTVTDGNGNITELIYVTAPTSGAGSIAAINYPTFTQVQRYDERGRRTKQIIEVSPEKHLETSYEYDATGNLVASIDPLLRKEELVYDAYGRVTRTVDFVGGEVNYVYDNRNNLLSVTDPEGNTTTFQYDLNDQKTQEGRPEGGIIQYSYDSVGDLLTVVDAKNQMIKYGYNDANQNISVEYYADAADEGSDKTITFEYDEVGNITSYDDGITSASYAYDDENQKTRETVNYGAFEKSIAYSYTVNGLKASFTGPDGSVVSYGYDANNQINSVQLPGGALTVNSYEWTAPKKLTYPGGVTRENQYDSLLRPINIGVKDQANNTLLDYVYDYDDAGNIDTKISEHGLYEYGYNGLDQLTEADNPTLPNEVYSYDGIGNRLTDNNLPGAWGYNKDNQLSSIGGQVINTYDANGSLIQKIENGVTTEYQYNLENRLTEITSGGDTLASYYYDPFGLRLWKEAGGQRTYFLYAEEGLVAELNGSGAIIRQFGFEPDSEWGTDPLYQKVGGQYYFYLNDHLGTPQKLVQATGAIVWSAKYSAFGAADVDEGYTVDNPLRFPGQYHDKESELLYNQQRYYSSETGRYITADPIGLRGGLNIYLYALSSPIIYVDNEGLIITSLIGAGLGAACAAVSGGNACEITTAGLSGAIPGIGGAISGALFGQLCLERDDGCEPTLGDRGRQLIKDAASSGAGAAAGRNNSPAYRDAARRASRNRSRVVLTRVKNQRYYNKKANQKARAGSTRGGIAACLARNLL